jgi:fatty acid desaturase
VASRSVDPRLPVGDLARLVKDLHTPSPFIYWMDLAGCVLVAGVGFYLSAPFPEQLVESPLMAAIGLLIAGFALYRASYFNHEIAHQSRRLPGFGLGWNVLIGIPLLIPAFLYSDHRNHHSAKSFGTEADVEYFTAELRGMRGAAAVLGIAFVLPVLYMARFLVVPPLAWVSPRARHWADTQASSLGLLGLAKRPPPSARERRLWRAQEAACFAYLTGVGLALLTGLLPVAAVFHVYTVIVILLILHAIRIMVGHRYESDGRQQSRVEQFLDSFNFTDHRLLTGLLAPLGFSLHALHHLFPNIPYHNMPEAHRRIVAAVPSDSLYRLVESSSYMREVGRFMMRGRALREAEHRRPPDEIFRGSPEGSSR